MASAPVEPITGRVDGAGNLVSADAPLLGLQEEAGLGLGQPLAVPQLAAVARLARKLGVPIRREVRAASESFDLDLLVRAEPSSSGVLLVIEDWRPRPPQAARWSPRQNERESAPSSLETFETDAQLRVVRLSTALARRLGKEPGDLEPTAITKLFRLEADEAGEIPLLDGIAAGVSFDGQRARARPDGGPLRLAGEPKPMVDGQFAGYLVQVFPAEPEVAPEERPRLEELLQQPLATIIEDAQQIAGRAEGPLRGDYATYASDIAGAARHLLDVIRGMGAEPPPPPVDGRLDLARLAAEAAGLVQAQAAARSVLIDVAGDTGVMTLGDGRAVTQILVNLIANATRFSPEGGIVQVVVSADNGAQVLVADEGPGVAPWDRDRIFDAYEQGDKAGEGVGLGLAISRRLARSMGGDIVLEDTGPGEGARFILRLPLA